MLKRLFSFFTIPFNEKRISSFMESPQDSGDKYIDDNNKVILQIDPEHNKTDYKDDIIYIISTPDKDQCGICYHLLDNNSIKINCHQFHKSCLEKSSQIQCCKHCNNTITLSPKNKLKE